MTRYFAFLRAINVGGHVVKMDRLLQLFESFGFSSVETFIASGNVIFETKSKNVKTLERKIENGLREALGYEVATFIRTEAELVEIANYRPFGESDLEGVGSLNIVFLGEALDKKSNQGLMALRTELIFRAFSSYMARLTVRSVRLRPSVRSTSKLPRCAPKRMQPLFFSRMSVMISSPSM